jgi:hypothetical protein
MESHEIKYRTSDPWTRDNCPRLDVHFQIEARIARELRKAENQRVVARNPKPEEVAGTEDEIREKLREALRTVSHLQSENRKLKKMYNAMHELELEYGNMLGSCLTAMGIIDTHNPYLRKTKSEELGSDR